MNDRLYPGDAVTPQVIKNTGLTLADLNKFKVEPNNDLHPRAWVITGPVFNIRHLTDIKAYCLFRWLCLEGGRDHPMEADCWEIVNRYAESKYAEAGIKHHGHAAKAAKAKKADRAEQEEKYRAAVLDLMHKNPHLSPGQASDRLFKKWEIGKSTGARYVKGMKKHSQNR